MRNYRWFAASVLALAFVVTLYAQRLDESVQVTVIEVPVTVVDRGGTPVHNLTREDFEVFDDGKRVPIEYFEVVDMAKVTAVDEPNAPLPPVATRHFVLMFDLANSSPGTIERATEAAKDFVNEQMAARDVAAVAVFTATSGPKMLTSFTRNRNLLANAIETLGNPKYFKISDPLMISATRVTTGDNVDGAATGARGGINEAIEELTAEQNRVVGIQHDTEAKDRIKTQLNNLALVARTLDSLRGQKQIILFSEGFDARLVQGRENLSFESTREETDQVLSGEGYKVDSDKRFGNASSTRDVSQMGEIFRRSDVVLHAIDIKGLRGNSDAASVTGRGGRSNEALFLITNPTGGQVFKNENDLTVNMTKMLRQQEVIYLLGFTARSSGKPGRFHQLKVKTKAGRVSHRPGYYEVGSKITELEKTLTLAEIMISDAPIVDVGISLAATPLPGPGDKARVPVVVEIGGPGLLQEVGGNKATANLYLYAFDDQNQVVDFLQQRIALDLTKAGETVRNSGVRYFGTLRLPKGNFAIKALVRVDESGRIGFVRSNIAVPAFDTATILPPVAFADPGGWVMLVGPARGDDYAYPFAAGETKYVPQRPVAVKAGGESKLALFLYRVPLENLQVSPTIVTNNGPAAAADVQLIGRTAADDRGGVKLLFNFKPTGLAAGEHELRFTVKAKDGIESVVSVPVVVL